MTISRENRNVILDSVLVKLNFYIRFQYLMTQPCIAVYTSLEGISHQQQRVKITGHMAMSHDSTRERHAS